MADLSGRVLGDYVLLEPVGRGGMAAVYRARHRSSGRIIAIKVLSPQVAENESFLLRFRREARVVQDLSHPHIVPVEAVGEVGGYAYLVMPYLPFGSLTSRLAKGPLTPEEGGRIFSQICSALDYAHSQGVIHRDVKPSNILLDENGNALLADFGLAQIADASVSLTGSALLGTPAYVSPEQVRGEGVDARSDQYSLGIVLYQLTTEKLPYEAESPVAMMLKHVNDPMPRPRLVNPNIPEPVERVILKATAKDPAERFESMAAMNAAFQAALAHALDPQHNPAPELPIPASVTMTSKVPHEHRRIRPWMLASALLLILGCILAVSLVRAGAQATAAPSDGLHPRLTAAAATIDALSTEIVSARGRSMTTGEVATAAAATASVGLGTSSVAGAILGARESPSATVEQGASSSATPTTTTISTRVRPSLTKTAVPADTPPLPTNTPIDTPLPTATAPALACDTSRLESFSIGGSSASVDLFNDGASDIQITAIDVDWPAPNGSILEIHLGGDVIWSQGPLSPPASVSSGWDTQNRMVPPADSRPVVLVFDSLAEASGYSVSVKLNNECWLNAAN